MTGTTCLLLLVFAGATAADIPLEWVDKDTGHRVIRLSQDDGSESLYFNESAFTPQGDKMILLTRKGVCTVDLRTRKIDLVVPALARTTNAVAGVCMGRRTRTIYYSRSNGSNAVAYATDLDSGATRAIGVLPGSGRLASFSAVNADETLLAGALVEAQPGGSRPPRPSGLSKGAWMEQRQQMHLPMRLFTVNIKTGEVRTFNPSTDWLNHVQASPTDPNLLLFCHEGPWQLVDRIWTIHTDGTELQLVHPRTMAMEIAGHEFFGADGRTVWYDLQTPRGEDFWVGGFELSTGRRIRYHLERDQWSVHYNVSPDGTLFAGDGGAENMVAHAANGKWIYLFHPKLDRVPPGQEGLIVPGVFRAERLVNMKEHNYALEPNVMFTPDGKWVVFRSNMFGPTHVFAVKVARE